MDTPQVYNPYEGRGPDITDEHIFDLPSGSRTPEQKLMWAILKDAIECIRYPVEQTEKRKKRLRKDCLEWVFREQFDGVFSFVNICEELKLSPEMIRKRIKRKLPEWDAAIAQEKRDA